jgi:hypothetical protein
MKESFSPLERQNVLWKIQRREGIEQRLIRGGRGSGEKEEPIRALPLHQRRGQSVELQQGQRQRQKVLLLLCYEGNSSQSLDHRYPPILAAQKHSLTLRDAVSRPHSARFQEQEREMVPQGRQGCHGKGRSGRRCGRDPPEQEGEGEGRGEEGSLEGERGSLGPGESWIFREEKWQGRSGRVGGRRRRLDEMVELQVSRALVWNSLLKTGVRKVVE